MVGRRTADLTRHIGDEVRRQRLDAGLSQRALAAAAQVGQAHLSRMERGDREPSLAVLQAVAVALGADLSIRLYPNTGPAIRDSIQAPMLESLLGLAGPRWRRLPEVAVHHPARGVIDVVLHEPTANVAIATEVESGIERVEQELRWAGEKAESLPSSEAWPFLAAAGPPSISRLLLLRATRSTRELAMRYRHILSAAYPASTHEAYRALIGDTPWPGSALLWADVVRGVATIRPFPPRGVLVGR